MIRNTGNNPLRRPNRRALGHAAMFLLCARISAAGAGLAGLLLFAPGALAVEQVIDRQGEDRGERKSSRVTGG